MGRRAAREELFKLLFEADMNSISPKEVLENFFDREEVKLKEQQIKFVKEYAQEISEQREELKEVLEKNMENWSLSRIGTVERVLLMFAAFEVVNKKVGVEIAVNEAVELAKKYGDNKSFEFINGVLANVIKNQD